MSLKRAVSDVSVTFPIKMARITDADTPLSYEGNQPEEDTGSCHGDSEFSDCWPRDWLCKDFPNSRVIAVNYTTDILWRPLWIKKRNRYVSPLHQDYLFRTILITVPIWWKEA